MLRFVRAPREKEKVMARLLFAAGTSHSPLLLPLSFGHACYLLSLVAPPSVRPTSDVSSYRPVPSLFDRSCPKTRPPPFIFGPSLAGPYTSIDRTEGRATRWNGRYASERGRRREGERETGRTPHLSRFVLRRSVGADFGQGAPMGIFVTFDAPTPFLFYIWTTNQQSKALRIGNDKGMRSTTREITVIS